MAVSIFSGCDDSCGWIAASIAALSYGSYGVPIKAACAKVGDVDPLVLQSYKTFVFFLSCWSVLLLGEDIQFTAWGIASGLIWVPTGTCGVYAIRHAGMATAIGTWASLCVMMNFIWGILVFEERVKSFHGTCGAFLLLLIGLVGMSTSSAPSKGPVDRINSSTSLSSSKTLDRMESAKPLVSSRHHRKLRKRTTMELEDTASDSFSDSEEDIPDEKSPETKDRIVICGGRFAVTSRQYGILGAVINGVCGGTTLIPMHYASEAGVSGANFLVNFACGSMLVNAAIWLGIVIARCYKRNCSFKEALDSLPSFYVKELWFRGGMSGVFLSIGMIGSMLAVLFLGQGVGNSFVETQILISGLWGIWYYKEISGRETILKWFMSAGITMLGILWLSFEHQSTPRQKLHSI